MMRSKNWTQIPKNLIDDAEICLRYALNDFDLNFMIQGDTCLGLGRDTCLSTTTKVEYNFDWLSERGLLAYINYAVFHPAHWALARRPGTGDSPGALLEDEPWTYDSETMKEEIAKTDAAKIYIEGWNVPFGDC